MALKFSGKASQFSAADELLVKVSVDGGPFTTIHTITSAESNDSYFFYGVAAIPIEHSWFPATASNMVLEFESKMTTGLFFINYIEVLALMVPPGSPLPPAGALPVADAGADTAVDDIDGDGFEVVTLDGTLSFDPDGAIVSYEWFEVTPLEGTFPIGSGATLAASFGHGSHAVQLIVTDDAGGSAIDTAVVTVNQVFPDNLPPVANAGPDQTIVDTDGNTLEVITFDGTASTDPDGTIVSYIWTKNGNPFNNAATFSLTQPIGVHTVVLKVTDNQGATATDTVVVTVIANDSSVTIDSFAATPTLITAGQSTTLSWTTTNADSVSINGDASLPLDGSISVSPTTNTVYTLSVTGPGGTAIRSVTVGVDPAAPVPPTVDGFSATPTTITTGDPATLSWTTTGADSVTIDNGVGAVAVDGSATMSPAATTTYTLTATGPGGTATSSIVVTVDAASGEALTITRFEFRAGKNEWRIAGTSSIPGPGNTMTLYIGPTAPGSVILGAAAVDGAGSWEYRAKDSSVTPDSSGTISILSSQGGKWEGISGVGPVPGGDPSPPAPDTTPPVVSLVDPGSPVGGTVALSATASDAVGVTEVEFLVDGVSIGTDTAAPYGLGWNSAAVADGDHVLTARASDAAGNVGVSASVTVTVSNAPPGDTTPPVVSLADPGSPVGGTVALSATASDDVGVTEVEFLVDGVSIGTDTAAPYGLGWNSAAVADGDHVLTARASDAAGNVGVSASVTVTVSNAPPGPGLNLTVTVTAPAQASRGDDLTVSAVIGDAGGSGASGIGATLTFDPPDGLRFRGSSQTQTINVPPGGLTTVSWTVEAPPAGHGDTRRDGR